MPCSNSDNELPKQSRFHSMRSSALALLLVLPAHTRLPPHASQTTLDAVASSGASARQRGGQVNLKGERHSSTNFVMAIIQQNYGMDICPFKGGCPFCANCARCDHSSEHEPTPTTYCCWKHGYADARCDGFKKEPYPVHLFVTRSPYPWVISMHSQPYEYDGNRSASLSAFLRAPFEYEPQPYRKDQLWWGTRPKERGEHWERHENPIQMLNRKYRSYLDFAASGRAPSANITVTQLYDIDALRRALSPLSQWFDLIAPSGKLEFPPFTSDGDMTNKMKMDHVWSRKGFDEAKEYEERELWRQLLSQDDLDFINSQLDDEVQGCAGPHTRTRTFTHGMLRHRAARS